MHLSEREIFHSYKKIWKVFHIFHLSWSIILYEELKNVGLFDRQEQELRDRYSWEKPVTMTDFKRHQDKNTVAAKDFLMIFRDEIVGYKG